MNNVVVFDIETLIPDDFVGQHIPMSVAVAYNAATNVTTVYQGERGKALLVADLRTAVSKGLRLVGHNAVNFDLNVLGATDLQSSTIDTMQAVQCKRLGKGLAKLETLAQCTLGRGKVKAGDSCALGKRAITGDSKAMQQLVKYCTEDVMLTYELYKHGYEYGFLYTTGYESVPVNFR